MKVTKRQLRRIIREERRQIHESPAEFSMPFGELWKAIDDYVAGAPAEYSREDIKQTLYDIVDQYIADTAPPPGGWE